VTGAGWYDLIYNLPNDNDSPATANSRSVPNDEFTTATRDLHGRKAEILDAFGFANATLAGVPVGLRAGWHTLLWGETLLLADNGILYAQAPLDVIKALSLPGAQAKELFLPVGQISAQVRPSSGVSFAAYYQYQFRRTRLPAAGSYFSGVDILDAGGERLLTGPPGAGLSRGKDLEGRDSGQWGAATRVRVEAIQTEFGLYFINFHEKLPQVYLYPGVNPDPATGKLGEYILVFPEDITVVGASFATAFGPVSFAGEAHLRHNTPLASIPQAVMPGVNADNDDNPLYAVGDTIHALLSGIYLLGTSPAWHSASLVAELGWQWCPRITENPMAFDPRRDRQAIGVRALFSPTYYQLWPHLDLTVPLTVAYNPRGKGPHAAFNGGAHAGGVASVGVTGEYRRLWIGSLQASYFFGPAEFQPQRDRHFLAFSILRTF
jgi:hypothetical protein